jgi:hypothetical protein
MALEKYNEEKIVIRDEQGKEIPDDPQYTKLKELSKEVKIPPTEVEIENPVTHKKALVTLEFDGTTDKKLGAIMLSPDATEDQRMALVNSWLWEHGRENSSLLGELFMYKGQHTRETRAFKTQTTETVEHVNAVNVELYRGIATNLWALVADSFKGQESASSLQKFKQDLTNFYRQCRQEKKPEHANLRWFLRTKYPHLEIEKADIYILQIAVSLLEGSEKMDQELTRLRDARLKAIGWGMYIDKQNKIHNIYDDDIEEVVKKEKKEVAEAIKQKRNKENKKVD